MSGAKQVWYPTGYTYNGGVQIALSVTAEHDDWETYALVTTEPTELEEGEITYYCAGCGGVVRTETLPVLTYHNVTVANNIQNGTVGVSTDRTYVGSTVTVTATPDDEDLFLYRLYYSGDGQQDVTIPEQDGVYSFIMPDCDVTVHAEFMLKNTIFVDFGAGHEDFVQAAFGEAEDFTVSGSVVSFVYVPTDEEFDNAAGAKEMFEDVQNMYIDYFARADNGESYMYAVALHPLAYYTQTYSSGAEAYVTETEQEALRDLSVEHSFTFYALWAQPVEDAVVTVTPPACGTEMTTFYRSSTVQVLPSPVFTATGGLGFEDYMIFYNNWDIGLHDGETTTLTGGNAYTAYGYLTAPWGSFLPDDLTNAVAFEGGTLTSWNSSTRQFRISVPVYHSYDSTGFCTGCGAEAPHDEISVTITDGIGVNFYLVFDDPARAGVNSVTVTYKNFSGETVNETYAKDDLALQEDGKYKLTVWIAPGQLADVITVEIGDTELSESVLNYCNRLRADSANSAYFPFLTALDQYAQTANNTFNYTEETIADVSGLTAAEGFDSWQPQLSASPDMISKIGSIAFLALTKPEFRFYMTDAVSEQTAAACTVTASFKDGTAAGSLKARFAKNAQGDVLVEVTGVQAKDLGRTVVVTITGLGDTAKRIEFAGYDFARLMVDNDNNAELGVALYNYGAAAADLVTAGNWA